MLWWVALGYDTVKIVEYAVKQANGTDPKVIQKVLENTKGLQGVYATYSWSAAQRNGFPDHQIVMNQANSFKDGAYRAAR